MLYDNTFEYAAVFIVLFLQIMLFSRRAAVVKSSFYYAVLSVFVMLTAITDIVSSYTISYANDVPIWVNYFFSGLYPVLFTSSGFVFLLYTDSLAKIKKLDKITPAIVYGLLIYELILWITTPWTKLLIYFDENLKYCHGSLFYVNYFLGIVATALCFIIVYKGRVRFSKYQMISLLGFIINLYIFIVIQFMKPDLLLGGFGSAVTLIFLYIGFENPADYFYKGSSCQNREAFLRVVKDRRKANKQNTIIYGHIDDYAATTRNNSNTQNENLTRLIADRLSDRFKKDAFILSADLFAVMLTNADEDSSTAIEAIQKSLVLIFEEDFDLRENNHKQIKISTAVVSKEYTFSSWQEMEDVVKAIFTGMREEDISLDDNERVEKAIQKVRRRKDLIMAVEHAIAHETFRVFYQPIYDTETNSFHSAEALVRLVDPELGFISPEEFIPITEEVGQILPLGEIVFKNVCRFIADNDLEALGIKYIEVNLSPIQLASGGVSGKLFSIMRNYKVAPSFINFEITETADTNFEKDSDIVKTINEMSAKGVGFSLDDFGSGFASMDYLFHLPVDLVKVDKSILWQAMEDEHAMVVLNHTIRMVRELDKGVLVEGVETKEMVDTLGDLGCHILQGYYYSKPLPENDFLDFLETFKTQTDSGKNPYLSV